MAEMLDRKTSRHVHTHASSIVNFCKQKQIIHVQTGFLNHPLKRIHLFPRRKRKNRYRWMILELGSSGFKKQPRVAPVGKDQGCLRNNQKLSPIFALMIRLAQFLLVQALANFVYRQHGTGDILPFFICLFLHYAFYFISLESESLFCIIFLLNTL